MNKHPGHDRAQWFPNVTVDNHSGRVYVFYYDQGIAKTGDLTRVAITFSDDGGVTWKSQRPLSDVNFQAGWGNDTGQPNLGDYNQAVAKDGELFAVWAQSKLVGFTDGQPDLSMTTPDVYFKRFSSLGSSHAVELPSGGGPAIADPPNGTPVFTSLLTENFDEKGLPPELYPRVDGCSRGRRQHRPLGHYQGFLRQSFQRCVSPKCNRWAASRPGRR